VIFGRKSDTISPNMFRWITQSRLRTALAILFFCLVLAISIPLALVTFFADVAIAGPGNIVGIAGLVTAFASLIGTISTVILAWRADRRTAKESSLKLSQMQQQITELELKLKAPSANQHTSASTFE
jgi:membrane protein implicated in regulation of membrane protease activity